MSEIRPSPTPALGGADARLVANLTRADGEDLLRIAPEIPVRAAVTTYPRRTPQALEDAARPHRGLRRPRRLA